MAYPVSAFNVKGISAQRRERIESAIVAGGRHVAGPHAAFIAADPRRYEPVN